MWEDKRHEDVGRVVRNPNAFAGLRKARSAGNPWGLINKSPLIPPDKRHEDAGRVVRNPNAFAGLRKARSACNPWGLYRIIYQITGHNNILLKKGKKL